MVIVWAGYTVLHAGTPVRIGVLLPVTGDVEYKEPLEWAKENINRQGGIGGRPVELVYKDTGSGDIRELARELLADDSVRIVIGPPTSDDVYLLAPEFIKKQKVLISPLTTSGDIIRAFGRNGYFWRTPQGDVAQVKISLSLMKAKGVHRIALLSENTSYGRTFYDWTGFFANEAGINLASISRFEPGSSLDADVAAALETNPEYILAACTPEDAVTIKRAIDRSGKPVKLFLYDSAVSPALVRLLGSAAEGIEGTSPSADPTTGFTVAFQEKFGYPPTDYAAPVYDALLLAAYTSARQDSVPFESLDTSVRRVVYGNGTARGWDAQEIHEAINDIRSGRSPAISGASGPLDYDTEFGVDPLITWYSHWTIEDGNFLTTESLCSAKTGSSGKAGESVARSRATVSPGSYTGDLSAKETPLSERKDFMAVLVGPSRGWINYRHQADALTVYTLLRQNGVDDDHIILMIYDDIPNAPENPLKGDIHNIPKGNNIRYGAEVDYSGSRVTPGVLRNVISGNKTPSSPVVVESNASTDLFVYVASHGAPGMIVFGSGDKPFTTRDFTDLTDSMSRNNRYREMVFFVDTCFGESIALNATAKGVLFITGAASNEPSLGAVYDMDIRQWLSDEFTSNVINLIRSNPDITFRDLYAAAYERVTGSHVRMINTGNVNLDQPVREFLHP
ncbi:MAG: C13 family peptidase [Methanoregula sp.]